MLTEGQKLHPLKLMQKTLSEVVNSGWQFKNKVLQLIEVPRDALTAVLTAAQRIISGMAQNPL